MKNLRLALLLWFLQGGLPLCVQTVKANWQTGAPFSTYKTFDWQDPKAQKIPFYGAWMKGDVITECETADVRRESISSTLDPKGEIPQ